MTLKSSLKFAKSLIFPKTEKKSSARRSLFGALLCIGLSIIPLIVVLSITNGMIDGMTERIIGLSSSHIQAYVSPAIIEVQDSELYTDFSNSFLDYEEVLATYPEVEITALATANKYRTGAQVRAMPKSIFSQNEYFKNLFSVVEGSIDEYCNDENENAKVTIIGQKLAEILNIHAGDTLRIITTKKNNDMLIPKLTSFKVSVAL